MKNRGKKFTALVLILTMLLCMMPYSILADEAAGSAAAGIAAAADEGSVSAVSSMSEIADTEETESALNETDDVNNEEVESVPDDTDEADGEEVEPYSNSSDEPESDEPEFSQSGEDDEEQDENEVRIKYSGQFTITSDITLPAVSIADFSLYGWDEKAESFGKLTNIMISEVYWQKYVDGAWVEIKDNNTEVADENVRYGLRFEFAPAEGSEISDDVYFEGDEDAFDIKSIVEIPDVSDSVRAVRMELGQSVLPSDVVATIGSQTFTDFDSALSTANQASRTSTIVLCSRTNRNYRLNLSEVFGNITIELNGRTLTLPSDVCCDLGYDNTKLTIKNRVSDAGGFYLAGQITIGNLTGTSTFCNSAFDYMDLCFDKVGGFKVLTKDASITTGPGSTVYISKDVQHTANEFAQLYPNLMYCHDMAFACIGSPDMKYVALKSAYNPPAVSEWELVNKKDADAIIYGKDASTQESYARLKGSLAEVLAAVRDDETILITRDCTLDSNVTVDQSFTVQFAGNNLTIADDTVLTIKQGSTVEFIKDYIEAKLINNGRIELEGTLNLRLLLEEGDPSGPIYINSTGTLILSDSRTLDEYLSDGQLIRPDLGATVKLMRSKNKVKNTYQYLKNVDGKEVWADLSKKYTVQLQSRIVGTDISPANVSGGGEWYSDVGTMIQADGADGYEFIGWYTGYSKDDPGTCESTMDMTGYYPKSDVLLTAVYRPTGTLNLTIEASKFKITDNELFPGTEHTDRGVYYYYAGTDLYLSFTDQDKDFLYWTNGSDMIVSREADYNFTLAKNTTLRAVYNNSDTKRALVVFKSDFGQIMSAGMVSSAETITMPVGPLKSGYTFIRWDKSAEEIQTAIASGSGETIEVTPVYVKETDAYHVTVRYVDADGNKLREDSIFSAESGSNCNITAPQIEGMNFSCWRDAPPSDTTGKILSCSTLYKAFSTNDIVVYAVYGADVSAGVSVNITSVTRGVQDAYYKLSFAAGYDVPESLKVIDTGFVMTTNEESASESGLVLDQYGVKTYAMAMTVNSGVFVQHFMLKNADKTVWMRAFVQVKDPSSGEVKTYYSDIVKGSYNTVSE